MHLTWLQNWLNYGWPWPTFSMSFYHFWHKLWAIWWFSRYNWNIYLSDMHQISTEYASNMSLELIKFYLTLTYIFEVIWANTWHSIWCWCSLNVDIGREVVQRSTLFLFNDAFHGTNHTVTHGLKILPFIIISTMDHLLCWNTELSM